MGITGRAMPLLSTLAALVIIVHSAEEELDLDRGLERDYRYDSRPRILDTRSTAYDQHWGPVDADPPIYQSSPRNIWEDSPEEPKRRRPGRKRKRRPLTSKEEARNYEESPTKLQVPISSYPENRDDRLSDLVQWHETDNTQRYTDMQYSEPPTSEMPRRRRKRPENRRNRWTDDQTDDADRPLRRRSGKRRRPQIDEYTRPQLAEFPDLEPVKQDTEEDTEREQVTFRDVYETTQKNIEQMAEVTPKLPRRKQKHFKESEVDLNPQVPRQEEKYEKFSSKDQVSHQETNHKNTSAKGLKTYNFTDMGSQHIDDDRRRERSHRPRENTELQEDKSLSEFSLEILSPVHITPEYKNNDNTDEVLILGGQERQFQNNLKENDEEYSPFGPPLIYMDSKTKTTKKDKLKKIMSKQNQSEIDINPNLGLKDTSKFRFEFRNRRKKIFEKSWLHYHDIIRRSYTNISEYQPLVYEKIIQRQNRRRKYRNPKVYHIPSVNQFVQNQETDDSNAPIDPLRLKEILKRSNGTSLSEVLQQHNLSLSDLLRGKEVALSALKLEELTDDTGKSIEDDSKTVNRQYLDFTPTTKSTLENYAIQVPKSKAVPESDLELQSSGGDTIQARHNIEVHDPVATTTTKRRYPNMRRKLRMRAQLANSTYKAPLSRDLMAQTARKYHNSRNITKSKEWKYVIPLMNNVTESSEESNNDVALTTTSIPEETTTVHHSEVFVPTTLKIDIETATSKKNEEEEDVEKEIATTTQLTTTEQAFTTEITTTTEKIKTVRLRPPANRMGIRRQAYNNRMKRKRMKQKNSTTESPRQEDEVSMEIFGMPNLVSSSEFIARTQTPKPAITNYTDDDDFTTLDDFMTTEKSIHIENGLRFTRNSTIPGIDIEPIRPSTVFRFPSTTEETAKFEIEEILNDTRTSARLSRILMERNMTLNELVEHRERGSSHVHLADIFHNASKEPNPPEPFLSKSLIEPISKETYPLRAILEANSHDSGIKATAIEPIISQQHSINIPVVMDFGNNVNENSESMGIISLFNKIVGNDISDLENSSTGKDSEGTPYVTTIITVNNTDSNDHVREDKALKDENNLKNDVVGWTELFDLMRKSQQNETDEFQDPSMSEPSKTVIVEDADGDGLIVLDELQRLKDLNSHLGSQENVDVNSFDRSHHSDTSTPGILDRMPGHTRSVTVAAASIVGLAIILFLLTYAAFKWKQQRNLLRKKQSFSEERIPTPVFESRKGRKNNCSTRSISPMLNTSNIYTLNTLDSSNGKDSPDYMWDSLRKPFQ